MTNNFDEAIGHRMVLFYSYLLSTDLLWTIIEPRTPAYGKTTKWFLNFEL